MNWSLLEALRGIGFVSFCRCVVGETSVAVKTPASSRQQRNCWPTLLIWTVVAGYLFGRFCWLKLVGCNPFQALFLLLLADFFAWLLLAPFGASYSYLCSCSNPVACATTPLNLTTGCFPASLLLLLPATSQGTKQQVFFTSFFFAFSELLLRASVPDSYGSNSSMSRLQKPEEPITWKRRFCVNAITKLKLTLRQIPSRFKVLQICNNQPTSTNYQLTHVNTHAAPTSMPAAWPSHSPHMSTLWSIHAQLFWLWLPTFGKRYESPSIEQTFVNTTTLPKKKKVV